MNYRLLRTFLLALLLIAAFAAVGSYTYNLGVAHGIAESGRLVGPNGAPVVAFWPRPWGFGFFPFFPLFFLFLFFFVVRGLLWRGRRHGGWRYRHEGVPPMFEEWHRRAHATTPDPGSRTTDPGMG